MTEVNFASESFHRTPCISITVLPYLGHTLSYRPPKLFICQYKMRQRPWNNLESVLTRFVSFVLASF